MVNLAGKFPYIWSYTVYIYGSGQPYSKGMNTYTQLLSHANTGTNRHSCAHTDANIYTHKHKKCTHTQSHTHTFTHIYTHTHTRTHMHTRTHTNTHTHTYTHIYTHTHSYDTGAPGVSKGRGHLASPTLPHPTWHPYPQCPPLGALCVYVTCFKRVYVLQL
jgi:hypothetical protein